MAIDTSEFKQVLLRKNNFFRTDAFSAKLLFQRGAFSHGDIILSIIIK